MLYAKALGVVVGVALGALGTTGIASAGQIDGDHDGHGQHQEHGDHQGSGTSDDCSGHDPGHWTGGDWGHHHESDDDDVVSTPFNNA